VSDVRAEVPLDGRLYRGRELLERVDSLARTGDLTLAAAAGLRWIVQHIEPRRHARSARSAFRDPGRRGRVGRDPDVALAGATVLWVDVSDPAAWLAQTGPYAGTLVHAAQASNLLEQPRAIRAAIERFRQRGRPGPPRLVRLRFRRQPEWRLGAR